MDATTVGLLGIVALLVLIFMGMNIGMALMAVGFFGFAIMTNFKAAISVLSTVPSTQAGSYSMIVVPLFILMGSFAYSVAPLYYIEAVCMIVFMIVLLYDTILSLMAIFKGECAQEISSHW